MESTLCGLGKFPNCCRQCRHFVLGRDTFCHFVFRLQVAPSRLDLRLQTRTGKPSVDTARIMSSLLQDIADWINRSVPETWMEWSNVRDLPKFFGFYLSCPGERSRISDWSDLWIGWIGTRKCSHASIHGLPKLLGQWGYACTKWDCAGFADQGRKQRQETAQRERRPHACCQFE